MMRGFVVQYDLADPKVEMVSAPSQSAMWQDRAEFKAELLWGIFTIPNSKCFRRFYVRGGSTSFGAFSTIPKSRCFWCLCALCGTTWPTPRSNFNGAFFTIPESKWFLCVSTRMMGRCAVRHGPANFEGEFL